MPQHFESVLIVKSAGYKYHRHKTSKAQIENLNEQTQSVKQGLKAHAPFARGERSPCIKVSDNLFRAIENTTATTNNLAASKT
jgi:hypothetical protein